MKLIDRIRAAFKAFVNPNPEPPQPQIIYRTEDADLVKIDACVIKNANDDMSKEYIESCLAEQIVPELSKHVKIEERKFFDFSTGTDKIGYFCSFYIATDKREQNKKPEIMLL